MKYFFVVLILAIGGDVAFNHAAYTNGVLGNVAVFMRGSSDAVSNSLFAW